MFGLSFWEIGIILVVALVILGPKKLPELARSLGKGIREFRKATDDFKSTMDFESHGNDDRHRQISPKVDDAEIMPEPMTPKLENADDAAKAALAEEEAKKAVEAAQVEVEPAQVEVEPETAKPKASTAES